MDDFNFAALPSPAVYVLLDGRTWKQGRTAFDKQINQLVEAGVCLIQFRDKTLSDREHIAAGERLSRLIESKPTAWIMNDRVDLAIAAGADGVHLGQEDMPIEMARKMMGAGKAIGISTHSIEQARDAVSRGADYIGVGPVFKSQTKQFKDFVGVDLVCEVAKEIRIPAFAIGGINLENAHQVRDAGLSRVAVSGVVSTADDAGDVVKKLIAELSKS